MPKEFDALESIDSNLIEQEMLDMLFSFKLA